MILIALENNLNLVIPKQETVVGQLLLCVLTVVGLTHRVVVAVVEVRHEGRRVLLSQHLVPVDLLEPRVHHQFFHPVGSKSSGRLSFEQTVDKVDGLGIPVLGKLVRFDRCLIEEHLLSNFLSVVASIRPLR